MNITTKKSRTGCNVCAWRELCLPLKFKISGDYNHQYRFMCPAVSASEIQVYSFDD